ncbi:MAG TPA: hypothetical protein VH186_37920 [Chloroflexia bacterium]|nr:hypothetical protein [Chloroflexia bacterium]
MHNIPTYFLLAILYVAWRWEGPGGFLFFLAGVSFFIIFGPVGGVVGMPLIIAALLFLLRWFFIEGPGRSTEAV